jgi:hypothetical protein
MQDHDGHFIRLSFPWVSISPNDFAGHPFVYFHNKKWNDLDEASEILRLPPFKAFHVQTMTGLCCVGNTASHLLRKGQMTPAEAFWMTASNLMYTPIAMRQNQDVLNWPWDKCGWQISPAHARQAYF